MNIYIIKKKKNMRYVKTFENFNPSVNEGWLWGEGNIFSKIGQWYSGWRNKKAVEAAEATKRALEDPANLDKLAKIQAELEKLSPSDIEELKIKMENFNPDVAAANAPEGTEEEIKQLIQDSVNISKTKYGTKLYESRVQAINENAQSLGQRILKALGLAGKYIGIIIAAIIVIAAIGAVVAAVGSAIVAGVSAFVVYGSIVATLLTLAVGRVAYGAITDK
jgi:hypothetical protein